MAKEKVQTNPNGANGTTGDEREVACWDLYIKSIANNMENAYKSAIEAGYSEDHSRNITMQGWFKERKEKLKRNDMLSKAERNLAKVLDFNMETDEGKVNVPVAQLVTGVSTTIVKSLGKENYSDRIEHTGKDGEEFTVKTIIINKA